MPKPLKLDVSQPPKMFIAREIVHQSVFFQKPVSYRGIFMLTCMPT